MRRSVTVNTTIGLIAVFGMFGMLCGALAQEAPAQMVAPLFLQVDWVRPASQDDTSIRYTPVQENIADPNVEIPITGREPSRS